MIKKIIAAASLIIVTGCSGIEKKTGDNDITTEGFLSDSVFQVIVKSNPDKNTRGLVNQRESAYMNAKSRINEAASAALLEYWARYQEKNRVLNKNPQLLNRDNAKSIISEKFKKVIDSGVIAHEYYRENASVVIVFRIEKNGLRQSIESIEILKQDSTYPEKGEIKK